MPKLTYSSQNFPLSFGSDLIGTKTIDVSWAELIWAAISVGKPEASHLIRHGTLSWYELLMRVYMLRVNLKESPAPFAHFEQTQVYKALDPSEKTSLSYFMGLTTAKLLTNRFLGVPWLVHLDSFAKSRLAFISKKRPDLLGLNKHREWLVMEAKGRSRNLPKTLLPKALTQTRALSTIDGNPPFLRVACASYAISDILFARWECPKRLATSKVSLDLQPREFLDRYYASVRNLLNPNNQGTASVTEQDDDRFSYLVTPFHSARARPDVPQIFRFNTVALPDLDLRIGLLNQPNSFFLENPAWHDVLLRSERLQGQLNNLNQELFIASDGILVQLGPSWNSENMKQEPNQRSNR